MRNLPKSNKCADPTQVFTFFPLLGTKVGRTTVRRLGDSPKANSDARGEVSDDGGANRLWRIQLEVVVHVEREATTLVEAGTKAIMAQGKETLGFQKFQFARAIWAILRLGPIVK
ncbi:ATP synthase subunit b [Gossypium arboreum]|uniref:ATP synthase subunit b n=1 Tax=Gossypium arboreum TaxID=29729 RepID=A0A0B0MXZ1_GOSAR|nr:ATP synthase subunit b [Gossypium arboreum]